MRALFAAGTGSYGLAAKHVQLRLIQHEPFTTHSLRLLLLILHSLSCSAPADKEIITADTSFSRMQSRGRSAMGVDQYKSAHVFESLPDGGRIVLQRDVEDSAGTEAIRSHMRDIAARFQAGDFTIPGMVHAQEVPGTAAMATRRDRLTYIADTLPRGGQVRIATTDPEARTAVHIFLDFQRGAHRAASHSH